MCGTDKTMMVRESRERQVELVKFLRRLKYLRQPLYKDIQVYNGFYHQI